MSNELAVMYGRHISVALVLLSVAAVGCSQRAPRAAVSDADASVTMRHDADHDPDAVAPMAGRRALDSSDSSVDDAAAGTGGVGGSAAGARSPLAGSGGADHDASGSSAVTSTDCKGYEPNVSEPVCRTVAECGAFNASTGTMECDFVRPPAGVGAAPPDCRSKTCPAGTVDPVLRAADRNGWTTSILVLLDHPTECSAPPLRVGFCSSATSKTPRPV